MNSIAIDLPHHRYEVLVESGGLNQLGSLVQQVAPHTRAALLIDQGLPDQHIVSAQSSLQKSGYDLVIEPMPVGENHKNLDTVCATYERLLSGQLERHSPVIAMGGGIVGDTAGFIAATYLRGVPFIQCPTTLLAMVDASVGGKVGVNLPQGKNLVGSFYQPSLVIIDTDTLSTLPDRQMRCGLAECIKHGIIRDAELFTWTENHVDKILSRDRDILIELILRNVQIKASVVTADEKELGQRAHLNFGHTFAHAIEAAEKFDSPSSCHHGEAVALGMVAATRLSVVIGRCDPNILPRLTSLLARAGLPIQSPHLPPTKQLLELMRVDKKVAGGQLRLVLPTNLGQVDLVDAVDEQHIVDAWDGLRP
ncbi:MAG: 3-dehydroquinate synthase [Phycisphaeraceae bacterium]|nr:3-dehydroquinate synthase [Phycisphaeraceae bacterium]